MFADYWHFCGRWHAHCVFWPDMVVCWRRAGFKVAVREVLLLFVGLLIGIFLAQIFVQDKCSSELVNGARLGDKSVPQLRTSQTLPDCVNTDKKHSPTTDLPTTVSTTSAVPFKIRQNQHEVASSVKRPKTWKQELKPRQALYVGVITAEKFLSTRAKAVNKTWGKMMPKLEFFSAPSKYRHGLAVVNLPDVDDSYPPQKKVYRMLKYMHDHYIDKFNWFMRADDDVYVRVPELLQFLSNLDPSEDLYIGSPGMGKKEDLQRIKLMEHERYCMGGPGVILSRSLLKKLVDHLEDCLQNVVVSWNEDLELGRCISRRLGVQCTWAYEMRKLFFTDYSKGEMLKSANVYKDRLFVNAITSHAFKKPEIMMRVHQFYLEIAVKKSEEESERLQKELTKVSKWTGRAKAFP